MTEYQINLDTLESTIEEYRKSVISMETGIETSNTVIQNTGMDVYQGEDADTFRTDFDTYVNVDFTDVKTLAENVQTVLNNGLLEGRMCKKKCCDFPAAFGGITPSGGIICMGGKLYCHQGAISIIKSKCTSAVSYSITVSSGADEVDQILSNLQIINLNSSTYTDPMRSGCEKVGQLQQHSADLTSYAVAVEAMDDSLYLNLKTYYDIPGDNCNDHQYNSVDQYNMDQLLAIPEEELTEDDKKRIIQLTDELINSNDVEGLQKVAETIGYGTDNVWTDWQTEVMAKIYRNGMEKKEPILEESVLKYMIVTNKITKTSDIHTNNYYEYDEYEYSFDQTKCNGILNNLDPLKNGEAYYSLTRLSHYTGTSINKELEFTVEVTTEGLSFTFDGAEQVTLASVDMNKVVGEGYKNMQDLGFTEEQIVALMSSIYTNEDIQFLGGLANAYEQQEYYDVLINYSPTILSFYACDALYQYSNIIFGNDIKRNILIETGEILTPQLQKFINALLQLNYQGELGIKYLETLEEHADLQNYLIEECLRSIDDPDILYENVKPFYENNAWLSQLFCVLIYEDKRNNELMMLNSAYSAKTAHPFQRNGALFRLKLSGAQLVD